MEIAAGPYALVAGVLLIGGVLLSKTSARFGIPSLLLFLLLGMLAGTEGLVGIDFDDASLASSIGVIALAFILFNGGLSTEWRAVRPVLAPGIALASVGVVASAAITGAIASLVLPISTELGMLLGAIIASTDAAAVFSILRSRGVAVRQRLKALLELESGSNDPAAVFLTVAMIGLIDGTGPGIGSLIGLFVLQMAGGAIAGVIAARIAVLAINRLHLEYEGLYPVLTLAFVLVLFAGTTALGASGFLAAYVAGLAMASQNFLHRRSLLRFHDAIAWLTQISMFVMLGLLVTPSALADVWGQGVLVAVVLIFVARPLAVLVTLLPFRLPAREVAFVSWVGLRGAVPIILATFPIVSDIDGADTVFNVVFFVVLISVVIQGTTIAPMATRLGVADDAPTVEHHTFEAVIGGETDHQFHEVPVVSESPAIGSTILSLRLPPGVLVILIRRGRDTVVPQGGTVIEEGDRVLLLATDDQLRATIGAFDPTPGVGKEE